MNIAIIPARKGSKRIKNKNIKLFFKKPMIAWTILLLKKSKLFGKIIVTSDSFKILKIAKKFGADILLKRSKLLSNDHVPTHPVILDAIKKTENAFSINNIFCVYPCNPFLEISDIRKCLRLLEKNKNSYVFPVVRYSHPIQRALKLDRNLNISYISKKFSNSRTQDLKASFFDAGQFYCAKKKTWLSKKKKMLKAIEIPDWRVHDIDNLSDWKRAQISFKYKILKKKASA